MKPDSIIIHHSLTKDNKTVNWNAIRRYHMSYAYKGVILDEHDADMLEEQGYTIKKPWSDIGHHFGVELVDNDYEILMGRMPNKMGAHCRGRNTSSLGICCIGNFDRRPPSDSQWFKCVELVKSLMEILEIPISKVHGHNEFSNKTCPGKYWDMKEFRKDIK